MARIKFKKGEARKFFDNVARTSALNWNEIAKECAISTRTLRDWRLGKHHADYDTVRSLSTGYGVSIPGHKKIDTYWYVHKGAYLGGTARYQKYGPLGTFESRRKGGKVSQERRRNDPDTYRKLGCNVRKEIKRPPHSANLAEILGIIMGDGSINDRQVRITLDRTTDREYAQFVRKLVHDVLGEKPSWITRNNVIELTLSGVCLVEVLEELGLQRGDKLANKIQIPRWIYNKKVYQKACLRGLFDTDGCIYKHRKPSGIFIGWTFSSSIPSLMKGVIDILDSLKIKSFYYNKNSLYIYKFIDIVGYMDVIGSHNPKHVRKVEEYKKIKRRRVAPNR